MMSGLQFSRRVAVVAGVVLPVAETARRWHQLADPRIWPFWLDDWVIGAFLLWGAWKVRTKQPGAVTTLAAAWGFACGMGYASFFSEITQLNQPDPSGFASVIVAGVKGLMMGLAVAALSVTLQSASRDE
jgi:hypothetical protein